MRVQISSVSNVEDFLTLLNHQPLFQQTRFHVNMNNFCLYCKYLKIAISGACTISSCSSFLHKTECTFFIWSTHTCLLHFSVSNLPLFCARVMNVAVLYLYTYQYYCIKFTAVKEAAIRTITKSTSETISHTLSTIGLYSEKTTRKLLTIKRNNYWECVVSAKEGFIHSFIFQLFLLLSQCLLLWSAQKHGAQTVKPMDLAEHRNPFSPEPVTHLRAHEIQVDKNYECSNRHLCR